MFVPAGRASPAVREPTPPQLVSVLLTNKRGGKKGRAYLGVEATGPISQGSTFLLGSWLGADSPAITAWAKTCLPHVKGDRYPWVRVHVCKGPPGECAEHADLHIQDAEWQSIDRVENLQNDTVRAAAAEWRTWCSGEDEADKQAREAPGDRPPVGQGPVVLPEELFGKKLTSKQESEVGRRLEALRADLLGEKGSAPTAQKRGETRVTWEEPFLGASSSRSHEAPTPGQEESHRDGRTSSPGDPSTGSQRDMLRKKLKSARKKYEESLTRKCRPGGRTDALRTMVQRAMRVTAEAEATETRKAQKKKKKKAQEKKKSHKRKRRSSESEATPSSSSTSGTSSSESLGLKTKRKIEQAVQDKPGALMLSFGEEVRRFVTDRGEGASCAEDASRSFDIPNLASKYYHNVLRVEAKDKINAGQHAELRTLGEVLDALWAGHLGRAGDILAQRFRAVEANAVENMSWQRAKHLEALPPVQVSSVTPAMRAEVERIAKEEARLEDPRTANWSAKGNGKDKDKGKKGWEAENPWRFNGGGWRTQGPGKGKDQDNGKKGWGAEKKSWDH